MTKHHTRAEIRRILAERDHAGLSYEEMSARVGVSPRTLSWWAWRERKESSARGRRPDGAFTELVAVDETGVSANCDAAMIEFVATSGIVARVPSSVDDATLARLLQHLERRC